jgi:3-oxoacyl-[acyl-carrier protein] reductase
VLQRFGRIDALINCAGTTRFIAHSDLAALDADEFHRTYDVNVVGAYQMVRACADALQASGQGTIVNVSSIGGVLGRGSSMAYAASKGALNTLTLALARSLAPAIRVNAIAPGFVEGGLPGRVLDEASCAQVLAAQTAASVLQRVSQPDEVAQLAWFLCTQAPAMTGSVLMMDNGLHLNAG